MDDDAWLTAEGDQVSRYWSRYRLVSVTNTRDFVLATEDAVCRPAWPESFRLADGAEDFQCKLERPRAFARADGASLGEYLLRALSHQARWRSRRIWRGRSFPMRAMGCRGSSRRARRHHRLAPHTLNHPLLRPPCKAAKPYVYADAPTLKRNNVAPTRLFIPPWASSDGGRHCGSSSVPLML